MSICFSYYIPVFKYALHPFFLKGCSIIQNYLNLLYFFSRIIIRKSVLIRKTGRRQYVLYLLILFFAVALFVSLPTPVSFVRTRSSVLVCLMISRFVILYLRTFCIRRIDRTRFFLNDALWRWRGRRENTDPAAPHSVYYSCLAANQRRWSIIRQSSSRTTVVMMRWWAAAG